MGGEIKRAPEDFYVEEVIDLELGDGDYCIVKVTKKNWDTLRLVKQMAKVLRMSQKKISFAGTKDKRAVTVQYFSIKGAKGEDLKKVSLKDVEIDFLGYSKREIRLGDLLGNFFKITVRGCKNGERFAKIRVELEEKGIPNFFGEQRFGTRFITHEVGKLILQQDFKEAFWVYVAKPSEVENEEITRIRRELWDCRDPSFGLKEFPKHLVYERTLLQKLKEGYDEKDALLSLPKTLKMMFVHAYQSYLFNKLLSKRIEEFGTLKTIFEDDWACYVTYKTKKPSFTDFSKVGINKRRVDFLMKEGYATLALPLIGYETQLDGWCKVAKEFLAEDNLDISSFKTDEKEFSSSGSYRSAEIPLKITDLRFKDCLFEFYLPAGCYGTVFLREFLKKDFRSNNVQE
ncbi:tRNA pseudouridine(13) synthase TruD [Candidatus Bathyarchaeota archaeon]|nr:tRNA pseudouridine(13) synthase TruD [Candidatus Bathyarchaeota archaeon]